MYDSGTIDSLERMFDTSSGFLVGFGIALLVIALIVIVLAIVVYVLKSIALMDVAKKNNIEYAWLAWLPCGDAYILGKLGFEIYCPKKEYNFLVWVLLGCSVATLLLSSNPLMPLVVLAHNVLSAMAYYYIFLNINKEKVGLYTVLHVIFSVGGLLLYMNRNKVVAAQPVNVNNNTNNNFCPNCGNKLSTNSKFCPKCGNKI